MSRDPLEQVARRHDRDMARFFTGRKLEIASFEDAVELSKEHVQTQFRIFQGAPGCGKTSLLTHLRANAPRNRLFVPLTDSALTSTAGIARCIDDIVAREPARWVAALGSAVRTAGRVGNLFVPGATGVGEGAARSLDAVAAIWSNEESAKRLRNLELVLVCDEAQVLNPHDHAGVLRMLHTGGVKGGVSSVLALAGLSHTSARIGKMAGVSRLARGAVVDMGGLSDGECAESVRLMLARCGIAGTNAQRDMAARRVGAMAQGWPQHLACAQAALANELLRVDRDLARVDFAAVGRDTDEARAKYYEGRLADYPAQAARRYIARVAAAVHAQTRRAATNNRIDPPTDPEDVADLCEHILEDERDPDAVRRRVGATGDLVKTLIEKGVLTRTGNGPYHVTIPSMETWLREHLDPDDRARRHLTPCKGPRASQGDDMMH